MAAGFYNIEVTVDLNDDADILYALRVMSKTQTYLYEGTYNANDYIECETLEITCTTAIERLLDGPEDYTSIIGSGELYTDSDFSTCQMLEWEGTYSENGLETVYNEYEAGYYFFYRVNENFNVDSLWGS